MEPIPVLEPHYDSQFWFQEISARVSFSVVTACPAYTPPTASLKCQRSHIMSNENADEPLNEMREMQKRIGQIVDQMKAMMIADLPPEEQREAKRWVRSMFERFTERARRALFFARNEAAQFGSTIIET